ncbi:GHMP kinase [Shimwellia pseudoproteus]|uniref:GHMP family kinase ATP-binding protein n=1 Tax=Shimwellia pseudoproteus TaxID=570012 RepID=UPI0018EC7D54|nr:GHMP kinase [Shimwellia pseudoproteus]MBJ3814668.1 GHMP kinase [Shimwellia pseudoproteus]
MQSAQARCPGSCGELIQGLIAGSEKLVSCPVDWFSDVTVCRGRPHHNERPLMRAMLVQVVVALGYPAHYAAGLSIRWHSTLPVARGMASSTADIAATALATTRLLDYPASEQQIARWCVALEPTDSTLFRDLTLFDHRHGQSAIPCPPSPRLDVLVLESEQQLITADYHRQDRQQALLRGADDLARAWRLLYQGCLKNDPRLVGAAATTSAIASQLILPKPGFAALRQLVEALDLYGLAVAHSGSVVGLLLDRAHHDVEQVIAALPRLGLTEHYPRQHLLRLIPGGAR